MSTNDQDPNITITLPLSVWSAIGTSLSERPHKEVAHLLAAISAQMIPQVEAAALRNEASAGAAQERIQ